MGMLVDGVWQDVWYDTEKSQGRFQRENAQLRNWITPDGSAGPTGSDGFPAQTNRYFLYVSLACPWAHRTLIFRKLKGLETHIDVAIVSPDMKGQGWSFNQDEGSSGDPLNGFQHLHQVYTANDPHYTGRVTVPVLWDKQSKQIVSNESAEIIRMFNSAFNGLTGNQDDYYPEELRAEIDRINERVYHGINNGVYKTGFATTQAAYEEAYENLFDTLDELEDLLATRRYLAGEDLTEADWRLFPTLIRFDAVYHGHFKCNRQRLEDFPNLSNYLRDLYQKPGIADTINLEQIKGHYYRSHPQLNPTGVVPAGPDIDYNRPHNRDRLKKEGTC